VEREGSLAGLFLGNRLAVLGVGMFGHYNDWW
jgi:hypothetical protein